MLLVKQINSSQHKNISATCILNYKWLHVSYSDHLSTTNFPFFTFYSPLNPADFQSFWFE